MGERSRHFAGGWINGKGHRLVSIGDPELLSGGGDHAGVVRHHFLHGVFPDLIECRNGHRNHQTEQKNGCVPHREAGDCQSLSADFRIAAAPGESAVAENNREQKREDDDRATDDAEDAADEGDDRETGGFLDG